ncbi:MAG TPA: CHASE2 domain-containing protein [Alphaproteobacteria bacterium]|nr:CHASE2 domain-containing protein [Alphaproteobacteria bacterium]
MKRALIAAIPFLVFATVIVLRVWDPYPIEQLRYLVFDTYQRLKPRVYDPGAPVRIVDIDNASLARIGQWPWPRSLLAELVDRLAEAGAAAIAFDVVFAEPDRSSPEETMRYWPQTPEFEPARAALAQLPSNDILLAEAVARTPSITGFVLTQDAPAPKEGQMGEQPELAALAPVLPASVSTAPLTKATFAIAGDDPRLFVPQFSNAVRTLPTIEDGAAGNGALNSAPDFDQILRRVPMLLQMGGTLYPSLSAEAMRVAQGAATNVVKSSGASGVLSFGEKTGVDTVRIGQFEIPTDAAGRMWVRFTRQEPRRYLSAWRVLEGSFDPALVAGHILFLGTSASGLHDIRATPLDSAIPGVEIHAQTIEQVIAGDFLNRPSFADAVELSYLLVLGLLLILILPRFGPVAAFVIGGLAAALVLLGAWYSYDLYGWMVDPVVPSLMLLLVALTTEGISFLQAEASRRQVRNAFTYYLAPELVDELASHPERLRLGGEQRNMSIMFCDVRGFTLLSERFKDDPQGLTQIINQFLTAMTEVVLRHKGTIDKYIGDCIMAFWNAPLEDAEHARHAGLAALEMRQALEGVNAELQGRKQGAGSESLQRAAERGIATAQYALGKAYRDGTGVKRDPAAAMRWFERAARQGYAPAQRNIGMRYAHGEGVELNPVEAVVWLTMARDIGGMTGFEGELEELRRGLDREATQAVETRLRTWVPTPERGGALTLDIGVGIASGNCVVGNMGSQQRFDYSVLGDSVNLASRLEGQTKTYGVPIIVSAATRALAPQLAFLELDLIAVKGKEEAVRMFALLGPSAEAQDFQTLTALHEKFLASYRGQRWQEARRLAGECAALDSRLADLYDMYKARIDGLERNPPGADWNGVFVAQTK